MSGCVHGGAVVDCLILPGENCDIVINRREVVRSASLCDARPCPLKISGMQQSVESGSKRFLLFEVQSVLAEQLQISVAAVNGPVVFITPQQRTALILKRRLQSIYKKNRRDLFPGKYSVEELAVLVSADIHRKQIPAAEFRPLPDAVSRAASAGGLIAVRFCGERIQYLFDIATVAGYYCRHFSNREDLLENTAG